MFQSRVQCEAQDMIELGGFVRDIFKLNEEARNFRIFGPDETMSNRLGKVFEVTNRDWNGEKHMIQTNSLHRTDVSWIQCSVSICVKAGWKGIFLQDVMDSLQATKHLSVLVDSMCSTACKMVKGCNPASLETVNCFT